MFSGSGRQPLAQCLAPSPTVLTAFDQAAIAVGGPGGRRRRRASQNSTTAGDINGMKTAATNDASGISGLTATATQYCQCGTGAPTTCPLLGVCTDPRAYVKVNTSAPFQTLLHYPGLPASLTLTAKAIMRYR